MSILHYFRGITKFTVKADKPMKLINELRPYVPLRSIKSVSENEVEFTCFYGYSKIVTEQVEKAKGKILKQESKGLLHVFYLYRKRWGLIFTSLVIFLLLTVSQNFVWEIRVEGNDKINDEEIVKILNEIGFYEGVHKKSVDIDSLVNNFLIREKRISWIAVNFDGSVAHVEVREGLNPEIKSKKQNVNIVASHDGIILRADVLEGGCAVSKGDVVYKGQLLVSAFIDRNDKSSLRGARGSVWANTEREVTVYVPLNYVEKRYNGSVKKCYGVQVLGKKINAGFINLNKKLFTKSTKSIKAAFNKKYPLPFEIVIQEYSEYTLTDKRRSEKQAYDIAVKQAQDFISKNSPSFVVADKEEKYTIDEDVLIYNCLYSGVENIAKQVEFEIE